MRHSTALWAGLAVMAAAAAAPAAEGPALPALERLPADVIGFLYIPHLGRAEAALGQFRERTGVNLGGSEQPLRHALAVRTDIHVDLDPEGSAAVVWLDPKRFRNRYTVYVLPVTDWPALLGATGAEPMGVDFYALTGTRGPRFVLKAGDHALVTSSARTMEAVRAQPGRLLNLLPPETRRRLARTGVHLHLDVGRLVEVYESEIASWFRASSGQIYYEPDAVAYADIFVAYMLAIADFVDQIETVDLSLRVGDDALGVDAAVQFLGGAPVADFLSAQFPAAPVAPPVSPWPLTSLITTQMNARARTDLVLRLTDFYLEKAPRPQPLGEGTKHEVHEAMQTFLGSLGTRVVSMAAPAATGKGISAEVTVYQLTDAAQFQRGLELLAAAWERLADQLNLYLRVRIDPDVMRIGDVQVGRYEPRMRFGIPARHLQFRRQLRLLYGADELAYLVALVGDHAVVGVGADTSLFEKTVRQLAAGGTPEASEAVEHVRTELAGRQNVSVMASLPLTLRKSLLQGGTPPERIGNVRPGTSLVGLTLAFEGSAATMASHVPYEQIRLARELLDRVAPKVTQAPESLFEPETTEPEAPETPAEGPATPEPGESLFPPEGAAPAGADEAAEPGPEPGEGPEPVD